MTSKRTVIWLGSGFSFGSQELPANRPPLGCRFFDASNSRVHSRLEMYPTLGALWKAQGAPVDLEVFWRVIDEDFNRGGNSAVVSEGTLCDALKASVSAPAHEELRAYYEFYSGDSTDIVGRSQAVAGFELKCLLQDLLAPPPIERDRLSRFWAALERPLRAITFNYDLYAEHSLSSASRALSYSLTTSESTVDLLKLHGSVQWSHKKYCDVDGPCRYRWANDGVEALRIPETLRCDPPEAWFGGGCHRKRCFHLIDPLMVGLRQKREFGDGEGNPRVRDFFGSLLQRGQETLNEADQLVVIGFSFSEADDYLWDHLSTRSVEPPKRLLCCYLGSEPDREYEERVQRFFGAEGTFVRSGFGGEFLTELTGFLN